MPIGIDRGWRCRWLVAMALAGAALSSGCAGWPGAGAARVSDPAPASSSANAAVPQPRAAATTAAPATVPAPASAAAPSAPARESVAPLDVPLNGAEVTSVEAAARAFFAYFDRVRQMSPGELGREFVRLDPPGNPTAVLELALALGQTRNPADTVRALGVLEPLLKSADPQQAPWRPLARLLAARYTEQRRLEEQVERQSQQLRDAQRRQEQLAQQLEALKAIERSLTNRPAAPAAGANHRAPAP